MCCVAGAPVVCGAPHNRLRSIACGAIPKKRVFLHNAGVLPPLPIHQCTVSLCLAGKGHYAQPIKLPMPHGMHFNEGHKGACVPHPEGAWQ